MYRGIEMEKTKIRQIKDRDLYLGYVLDHGDSAYRIKGLSSHYKQQNKR